MITLIDVQGAYPGLGAEERGQAEAIARNLREMARLEVPFIAIITGEGGSGGALAIAVADRVLMLENSIYSVISPEGCASIMWRDSRKKDVAPRRCVSPPRTIWKWASATKWSPSPAAAHITTTRPQARSLGDVLEKNLEQLEKKSTAELLDERYKKFRNMAQFYETVATKA